MTSATRPLPAAAAEMNVTPMLDVLLVLLILFMAMSIRKRPTVDVSLPVDCHGVCASGESIVLEIRPGPDFRINRRPVPAAALASEIKRIYTGRPDKAIQVAGYPGISYQDVVSAIDVVRSAGVVIVGIAPKAAYLPVVSSLR